MPSLDFRVIDDTRPFTVCGVEVTPVRMVHGKAGPTEDMLCLGFVFGSIAYLSDCSEIKKEMTDLVGSKGIATVFIDALRPSPVHASHFSVPKMISSITFVICEMDVSIRMKIYDI